MRTLVAPATILALLLAVPSRSAGHVWLRNHPIDAAMLAVILAIVLVPATTYLGWRKGRALAGALSGLVMAPLTVAILLASSRALGDSAVWVAWLCGWIVLSLLQSFLDGPMKTARAVRRGIFASAVGGIGFAVATAQLAAAAAAGTSPANLPFGANFLAWMVAYGPGASLLMRR